MHVLTQIEHNNIVIKLILIHLQSGDLKGNMAKMFTSFELLLLIFVYSKEAYNGTLASNGVERGRDPPHTSGCCNGCQEMERRGLSGVGHGGVHSRQS